LFEPGIKEPFKVFKTCFAISGLANSTNPYPISTIQFSFIALLTIHTFR